MKKAKRQITYTEAHNRAVRMFQRTSIFLLWAGVVNVFALIIGVIQNSAGSVLNNELVYAWPRSGFAMCFSLQIYLNKLLLENLSIAAVADIVMILIALVLGGAFAFGGFLASKGKWLALFIGTVLYALDFGAMFFVYHFGGVIHNWTNYAFTLAVHVIVLGALVIAISQYYNVIHIEKVFKGSDALNINEDVESEVIASGK